MLSSLLRRLAASALLLLLLLTFLFFLLHLAPGEPAALITDPRVPAEQTERLREVFGLDRPLLVQYGAWLRAVVLRFDFGQSFSHQRPAAQILAERLPMTFALAGSALAINLALGLGLGLWAARRHGKATDHLVGSFSLLFYSIPVFWLGLMAILLFAELWPLLPAGHSRSVGAEAWPLGRRLLDLGRHLVLPATVLGAASCGLTVRLVRNSLLEELDEDYMRTARAKGLSTDRALLTHALPNALGPLLQMIGLSLPALLNGSVVIETVFAWPGVGRTIYQAILDYDYPLILAATALSGALVIAGNLLADLLQAVVNPRLRHG